MDVTIGTVATKDTPAAQQTCPACGTAIDTADADPLVRIACPKCGEKVRVERSFDQFVVVETLGIGGMGTVYKARDTLLDRMVALKLLRKDLDDEIGQTSRLQQEARAAAAVNHPNVIQVFSSGTDHKQFYLVMELVDHGSLDDFIEQRKRLPEEQVLEAGIQVAKGLRAAHGKGLIHRDVKPANILFADEHTAKIGDFGLAGVAAQKAETRGEIWGTPYYVAPERLDNATEDFRSDIYSLGATLFHAVAGRAPIEGETNSAVALRELKNHPVELVAIAPEVSAPTARVFHRMIAPDPEQRFASYDELVAELEKAQRMLHGGEDVDPGLHRRKRNWLLGGAAALLLVLGLAGFFFLARKPPAPVSTGPGSSTAPAVSHAAISLAEIERQTADARRDLLRGHHKVAHAAFARIASDAKNRQPHYDWVRLQQGLTALVAREKSQARQAFQEIENAGESGFTKEDVNLSKFFVTTAKKLLAPAAITAAEATGLKSDGPEALALLLFGLKDVTQNDAKNAIPLLEQFLTSQPSGKVAWIAEYKPLAQKYLDDCRLYQSWKEQSQKEPDAAQLKANLENLRQTRKKLKMHSALSEELSAEEKRLAPRVTTQQKVEGSVREAERQKVVEAERPRWEAALAAYKKQVISYEFEAARDTTKAVQLSDSPLKDLQNATQKKAEWLVGWKTKLIEDLKRTPFAGAVSDISGAQYTGIVGANPQRFMLKTPYGTVELDWIKFAPQTLLTISSAFAKPGTADLADRQWLNAVFAAETGQSESARPLAEAAAKAKPEYRDQIPLLFPPASSSR